MENKYFFHHIRRTGGIVDKNIDIKDTLDLAKKDFRTFLGSYAYGYRADTDMASAMITDSNGSVILSETWVAPSVTNMFFLHRIKHEAEAENEWVKGIEVKDTYDSAKQAFNAYLGAWAYGNGNNDFVDCKITDAFGAMLMAEAWKVPEEQPEPEPEPVEE